MIFEIGLGIGAIALYRYLDKNSELFTRQAEWNKLMEDNKLEDYKLISTKETRYGVDLIVNNKGLSIAKLIKNKDILESHYNATIDIQQSEKNKGVAIVSLIKKKFDDSVKFEVVKCKAWELYLGQTYKHQPVVVSMRTLPHLLYTGATNSGKTYCLLTCFTNLISQYSKRYFEMYLAQVSSKKDIRKFKDVEHCRGYAENMEDAYKIFNHINNMMKKRIEMFNKVEGEYIDDIFEWNKKFPKKYMRVAYLVMDEFTAYMPNSLDNKDVAKLKRKCLDILLELIQQGRAVGIYCCTSLQRSDRESLPPRVKSQFNVTASFRQNNMASSLTTTDSNAVLKLKPREALISADQNYLLKTVYLDNNMIAEFIADRIDMTHSNYIKSKKEIIKQPKKTVSKRIEGKNVKAKKSLSKSNELREVKNDIKLVI